MQECSTSSEGTSGGCNLLAAGKHALRVIEGVQWRGARIGERTDSHGKAWITPEIVRGGFSTARHVAGGSPKPHEAALVAAHGIPLARGPGEQWGSFYNPVVAGHRESINRWCLTTPEGRGWLLNLSRSGLYRLQTPEEGCLLVIVMLEEAGIVADHIVKEVAPWFGELRFFPEPADTALPDGLISSLYNVGELLSKMNTRFRRFESKVVKEHERLLAVENIYVATYSFVIERAQRFCTWWLDSSDSADGSISPEVATRLSNMRASLISFGFEKKLRHSFLNDLFDALEVAAFHGRQTRESFVDHIQRHADSASDSLARRRTRLSRSRRSCRGSVPPTARLSRRRQAFYYQLRGLIKEVKSTESPSLGLSMVRVAELSSRYSIFRDQIKSVARGTISELAAAGVLCSSRMLARQAECITAIHRSTRFAPDTARVLAQHLLTAFLARRSRLLLDLKSQVRISEVPWFDALSDAFERKGGSEEDGDCQPTKNPKVARKRSLRGAADTDKTEEGTTSDAVHVNALAVELFKVHLTYFAATQLPNSLVTLLGDYLDCRGLVKEIAADIFEGGFGRKFAMQAKEREKVLSVGTPYGDYYASVLVKFPANADSRAVTIEELGFENARGRNVANNGVMIERVAVATTHNLLHLVMYLQIDDDAALLETAASVALAGLIRSLRTTSTNYRFRRNESRRAANACRAFMVFVSLLLRKPSRKPGIDKGYSPPVKEEDKGGIGIESPIRVLIDVAADAAAGLPENRAAVLHDIIAAVEKRSGSSEPRPLMGWCRPGEEHPVFSPSK